MMVSALGERAKEITLTTFEERINSKQSLNVFSGSLPNLRLQRPSLVLIGMKC